MMYGKARTDLKLWQEMMYVNHKNSIDGIIENGWSKYIAQKLGKYDEINDWYEYTVLQKKKKGRKDKNMEITSYLEELSKQEHPMPMAKNRKLLIKLMDVRAGGHQQAKIHTLNGYLQDNDIPFVIVQYRDIIDGKDRKAAWRIDPKHWKDVS